MNAFTHLSDRSSGTTMTANMPKLIARVRSRSIDARTSKSFGPAKNWRGASGCCGSSENETRSRVGLFEAAGGAILESKIDGRSNRPRRRGRAVHRVERIVQRRRRCLVACLQRERQRLRSECVLDDLLRLMLLIDVMLQSPALETSAAIGED